MSRSSMLMPNPMANRQNDEALDAYDRDVHHVRQAVHLHEEPNPLFRLTFS